MLSDYIIWSEFSCFFLSLRETIQKIIPGKEYKNMCNVWNSNCNEKLSWTGVIIWKSRIKVHFDTNKMHDKYIR